MRIVLDTDVVVAAMRSPTGASAAILLAAADQSVDLLMSVPLVVEYEATCSLAEHRLAAGLSAREVAAFLDGLVALGDPVECHFLWRPLLRDPNDEMVVETAVNGSAEAIVTFNVRDYAGVAESFGIQVMLPGAALKRITG